MLASIPAARTNPWAFGTAALLNTLFAVLLLLIGIRTVVPHAPATPHRSAVSITDFPLFAPAASHGGQGGGQNDLVEASRGHLPPVQKTPLTPPQIPVLDNPRLAINNAIAAPPNLRLPDDQSLTAIGLPHSSNVTVLSGGPGTRNGIGTGDNGGVGPGSGNRGWGPGDGDSIYTPGGEVSAPVALYTPEAEFSDEARRNKFQGVCMIAVIIDAHGNTRNPRVIQPLGMGLDEKALEAVSHYRFRPALRHGKPVASRITVMVNFRLM